MPALQGKPKSQVGLVLKGEFQQLVAPMQLELGTDVGTLILHSS